MSVQERHLITGTWFMTECDDCGSVLSEHMGTPWGSRDRSGAVRHIQRVGWTDRGTCGEYVACAECEAKACEEAVLDAEAVHT